MCLAGPFINFDTKCRCVERQPDSFRSTRYNTIVSNPSRPFLAEPCPAQTDGGRTGKIFMQGPRHSGIRQPACGRGRSGR